MTSVFCFSSFLRTIRMKRVWTLVQLPPRRSCQPSMMSPLRISFAQRIADFAQKMIHLARLCRARAEVHVGENDGANVQLHGNCKAKRLAGAIAATAREAAGTCTRRLRGGTTIRQVLMSMRHRRRRNNPGAEAKRLAARASVDCAVEPESVPQDARSTL